MMYDQYMKMFYNLMMEAAYQASLGNIEIALKYECWAIKTLDVALRLVEA